MHHGSDLRKYFQFRRWVGSFFPVRIYLLKSIIELARLRHIEVGRHRHGCGLRRRLVLGVWFDVLFDLLDIAIKVDWFYRFWFCSWKQFLVITSKGTFIATFIRLTNINDDARFATWIVKSKMYTAQGMVLMISSDS